MPYIYMEKITAAKNVLQFFYAKKYHCHSILDRGWAIFVEFLMLLCLKFDLNSQLIAYIVVILA